MSVNKILSSDILKDNILKYSDNLEYLEGDNYLNPSLDSEEYNKRHNIKLKRFIGSNNKFIKDRFSEIINLNNRKLNHNLVLSEDSYNPLNKFDIYQSISEFFTIEVSYSELLRIKGIKILPRTYKDFSTSVSIESLFQDYNNFSCIFDENSRRLYISDTVIDYMIKSPIEKFKLLIHYICPNNEKYATKFFYNYLSDDFKTINKPRKDFKLDYIPEVLTYSKFSSTKYLTGISNKFNINAICINLTPELLIKSHIKPLDVLYYNFNLDCYFSREKNQTSLNVLACDIARNGLKTPLTFVLTREGLFPIECYSRLVVTEYLNLPEIPCFIAVGDVGYTEYEDSYQEYDNPLNLEDLYKVLYPYVISNNAINN